MKMFKKLFGFFALIGCLVSAPAFAAEDVDSAYWASAEINEMVSKDVMLLDADKKFNPEASVSRGDFVNMLVKVLGHKDLEVAVENPYTDINSATENFNSIMKSEELGLVYRSEEHTSELQSQR